MLYIGYDPKEAEAYDVCKFSINQVSDMQTKKLWSGDIPEYNRGFPSEPQSTDFTFTRFLVPWISRIECQPYSIFCDSDFLFLKDPINLIWLAELNPDIAVHVCKHPKYFPNSSTKMNNIPQHTMHRKNWSSLMVFNNNHSALDILDCNFVNTTFPGRELHEFSWLKEKDIGSIPLDWNCLAGYYHLADPLAIHFTDGLPTHGEQYEHSAYADSWLAAREDMLNNKSVAYRKEPNPW